MKAVIPGLAVALGVFLVVVGVTHFVFPGYYRRLVPPWLPRPRLWVAVSGAVEIVIGVGLLLEATRTVAAWAAVALLGVYVLTHIEAWWRVSGTSDDWLTRPPGAVARVVVNVAYLAWALVVAVA